MDYKQVLFQNIIFAEDLEGKIHMSIFVGWFLKNFTSEDVSLVHLTLTLVLACINALYLFIVYRILSRKTFYTKRCNIAISGVTVVTTALIYTIQSNLVLALGVIGALAIVRFRTALKDSLDISFLFWAVTVGICIGAQMAEIAIILSAFLTIVILWLEGISLKQECRLLIMESDREISEGEIVGRLQEQYKFFNVKKRDYDSKYYKLIAQVKIKKEYEMLESLKNIPGLKEISLIDHEGEHNY